MCGCTRNHMTVANLNSKPVFALFPPQLTSYKAIKKHLYNFCYSHKITANKLET